MSTGSTHSFFSMVSTRAFGRQRQGDDQHVDVRDPGEFDQFADGAEFRITGNDRRRAHVVAVIENAADADVIVWLHFERADQAFGGLAAADNHGAPLHHAIARPLPDEPAQDQPQR